MERIDDTQLYLPELWSTYARFQPDRTALVCGERRLTWRELDARMNQVANRLRERNTGRGDKVAVLMGNSAETLAIMFGIVKSGACLVPVSAMLTAEQISHMLRDSGAGMLFVGEAAHRLAEGIDARLLGPDARIAVGFEADGYVSYEGWIDGADTAPPLVRYEMDDAFNIIYSSGTTGEPKGILQTHRARQHWSYSNALEMRFTNRAVALATTALYSNGTMFMVLPPMFVGATVVVLEQFSPGAFLETVQRERVTHTFMVPTQYITTLEHPQLEQHDLSSLEVMLSAGSPLRADTKEAVRRRMGEGLFELYGFSEGFATILKPEDADRVGSVGKPVIGFDLRILDDEGKELPAGEPGEIAGYGAGLMSEYYRKPELTAATVWRDRVGRSFVRSGDVGKVDEDGFLYLLDRKKDMIISGGFNIFPKDIEAVVGRHEEVSDVTVIGVPHPKWGEAPLALVIPAPGTRPDPQKLREWANGQLAKTQRLVDVELRDDFPRNALGKVVKRQLREPYWKE